jgi:hypothetical protein
MSNENYQPTTQDLQEASNFIVQYLFDNGFEGNLDDGTALYDLLIKPTALIYSLFSEKLKRSKAYYSLNDAIAQKDALGSEFNTVIDSILSNWFISRKDGLPSTGVIRLVFTRPLTAFEVHKTDTFTAENLSFHPIIDNTFTENDFRSYLEPNRRTYYYVDLPVISEKTTSVVIKNNAKFVSTLGNVYFVKANALGDFVGGEEVENSDRFIARAKHAITTRELISYRAIATEVLDKIYTVRDVFVAGHGDKEQQRDVINFDGTLVHVGNMADIYIYSNFTRKTYEFDSTSPSLQDNTLDLSHLPIVHLFSVSKSELGETLVEPTPITNYHISGVDSKYAWSTRTAWALTSPEFSTAAKIILDVLVNEEMPLVESLLFNADSKVTCFDPLVKSFFPMLAAADMQCRFSQNYMNSTPEAVIKTNLKNAFASYTNGLASYLEFSHTNLISFIHTRVPDLLSIVQPLTTTFTFCDPRYLDGTMGSPTPVFSDSVFSHSLTQRIQLLTDQYMRNFTARTIKYYSDPTLVDVSLYY